MEKIVLLFSLLSLFVPLEIWAQDQTMVNFESQWKYLDDGSDQGSAWRQPNFDDSSWASGQGMLGYGTSGLATIVSFGPSSSEKFITTYFRHQFTIADVSQFKNFLIQVTKDDAVVIYVNGQEAMRSNFSDGNIKYDDTAYSSISGNEESIVWEKIVSSSFFQDGENVIAAEVHQRSETSSDLIFDLAISGFDAQPELYRVPYLQKATSSGMTIKWMTTVPTDSKVWYGTDLNNLSEEVASANLTIDHEIDIQGLTPDTKYYYRVGDSFTEFAGGNVDHFFQTNPEIGTAKPTRIWVTGDAGTGKDEQLNVKNAYLNHIGSSGKSDLWLMLGDNAYEHGRQADYQMGLFKAYEEVLINTPSFPVSGNHDMIAANAFAQSGTYFDIFALPKDGECGGVPSGTEAYWSFDYGNIHCVALETYDIPVDSAGTLATWLKSDLEATTADWLIIYFHFPPYSKVSHDTDDPDDFSGRSTKIRRLLNPIMERYGVDLVLSGHSHGYERSYLLNGHYGFSNTLEESMILDGSSGNLQDQTPYKKPPGLSSNNGTVYAVAGSSGKLSSLVDGESPHPAMYITNTQAAGSMILDIAGDTLEGKFLNEQGIIQDYFHIVKGNISPVIEPSTFLNFKVYPNPTQDLLRVKLSLEAEQSNCHLEFYSTSGRMVKKAVFYPRASRIIEESIDINDLTPGIYTIKFISNNQHIASKLFVVQ